MAARTICRSDSGSSAGRAAARSNTDAGHGAPTARLVCAFPRRVRGGVAERCVRHFYWIGTPASRVGDHEARLILFDTMNSEADARDIIVPA